MRYAEELLRKLPPDWRPDLVKEGMRRLNDKLPLNIFCAQEIDRLQVGAPPRTFTHAPSSPTPTPPLHARESHDHATSTLLALPHT